MCRLVTLRGISITLKATRPRRFCQEFLAQAAAKISWYRVGRRHFGKDTGFVGVPFLFHHTPELMSPGNITDRT